MRGVDQYNVGDSVLWGKPAHRLYFSGSRRANRYLAFLQRIDRLAAPVYYIGVQADSGSAENDLLQGNLLAVLLGGGSGAQSKAEGSAK
ncbi:MAG: hypothetical protein IPJ27_05495 [Candidatus Accumulibacter sp.]|uniref:Uncharacterized protein n=1 Tax=Candidatus Accumulibacter proximus TaxID=2954385 RepID=A0A935PYH8_9PROT|nr:hypothetical protein [Candidatus Accumulibacter proximus]